LTSATSRKRLLIVDDDLLFCYAVADDLGNDGIPVQSAHTVADGRQICAKMRFDVVILDNTLPDGDGLSLVPDVLRVNDRAKIILVTAFPSFQNAVDAIKSGIYDYLSKPVELGELRLAVDRAFRTSDLERVEQVQRYKETAESEETVIVGTGQGFDELRELISKAATASAPVLITGESGTGKGLVAKSIHYLSSDKGQSFISVNCAAIPETLVEAELFGVEKGAYTGATATRKGLFEIAENGTLFLDEIAEMPIALQSKLLGVLEDRTVRRLGSELSRSVNVRIIAATNAEPEKAIADGKFRLDLFYRLNVIRIHIPPLRERRADIPVLCELFLKRLAPTRHVELSAGEIARLMDYDWPGNVRELRNVLERCLILQDGLVVEPSRLLGPQRTPKEPAAPPQPAARRESDDDAEIVELEVLEKKHILRTYEAFGGNNTRVAEALGISLATLKRKLKSYGVSRAR